MATFITQARFAKDGLMGMIAAPEDQSEIVGRLIAQVGGKLVAHYLTSGDYDVLIIFEGPSYEEVVPALIAAAAGSGLSDFKTVTALTSSEMKSAFVKAGSIAASDRSAVAHPGEVSQGPAGEAETEAKTATAILNAQTKAVDDIEAGRPAPYYFAPPGTATPSQGAASPVSTNKTNKKK